MAKSIYTLVFTFFYKGRDYINNDQFYLAVDEGTEVDGEYVQCRLKKMVQVNLSSVQGQVIQAEEGAITWDNWRDYVSEELYHKWGFFMTEKDLRANGFAPTQKLVFVNVEGDEEIGCQPAELTGTLRESFYWHLAIEMLRISGEACLLRKGFLPCGNMASPSNLLTHNLADLLEEKNASVSPVLLGGEAERIELIEQAIARTKFWLRHF